MPSKTVSIHYPSGDGGGKKVSGTFYEFNGEEYYTDFNLQAGHPNLDAINWKSGMVNGIG